MKNDLERMIDGIIGTQMAYRVILTHLISDAMRAQPEAPEAWAERFISEVRLLLENHRDGVERPRTPFGWAEEAIKTLDGIAKDIRLTATIQAEKRASE